MGKEKVVRIVLGCFFFRIVLLFYCVCVKFSVLVRLFIGLLLLEMRVVLCCLIFGSVGRLKWCVIRCRIEVVLYWVWLMKFFLVNGEMMIVGICVFGL